MKLNEALERDLRDKIKDIEVSISKNLAKYLIKVMTYKNKKGYNVNIMLNTVYNKLEDKSKIKSYIKKLAKKNDGVAKSLSDDSVIKIYFKEVTDEVQ